MSPLVKNSIALAAARAIYGPAFNPLATLKALSYFEDGNVARLPAEVRTRLLAAVQAVDLDHLPAITPAPRREAP